MQKPVFDERVNSMASEMIPIGVAARRIVADVAVRACLHRHRMRLVEARYAREDCERARRRLYEIGFLDGVAPTVAHAAALAAWPRARSCFIDMLEAISIAGSPTQDGGAL